VSGKSELRAAVEIFIDKKVGALPVVDNGQLVGILTEIDILKVTHKLLGK